LNKLGYTVSHQKGSHIRLVGKIDDGNHRITIPNHSPIKIGTLNNILNEIAATQIIDKSELIRMLNEK